MNLLATIAVFSLFWSGSVLPRHASFVNEYKIARAVRQAVRSADSTLLATSSMKVWRDYLKIAAVDLDEELQPLLLIKFDEDIRFRNQLKTIIEWEKKWSKRETEHYIYYFRWDQPPPDIILEVQEAHFNEISKLFEIEPTEKIPFRYDLNAEQDVVYPYSDLRGGIVSSQPFDLENGARAILYFICTAPEELLQPLTRIYGSYFQNRSTSEAYYDQCLDAIRKRGYTSVRSQLDKAHNHNNNARHDDCSIYAFVYQLDQEFGPQKMAVFLKSLSDVGALNDLERNFQTAFGISLTEFEDRFRANQASKKL